MHDLQREHGFFFDMFQDIIGEMDMNRMRTLYVDIADLIVRYANHGGEFFQKFLVTVRRQKDSIVNRGFISADVDF